jgi:23S rRNA (adenine-N6)-dimethyltransferase
VAGRRAQGARIASRRAHGRHFLRPRLAEALVEQAGIRPGEHVVDLGAGSGRLTRALCAAGASVTAVELDPELAAALRTRVAATVVEGDALRVALPREPFRVLANVPFDQTTAILRRLLDEPAAPLERADLVVQWEVARKRTAVWPATLLGVLWGPWWELTLVRRLPARCFEPAPAVDAGLIRIVRREPALVPIGERARFAAFVREAWHGGGIRAPARTLRELGLGRRQQPRDLDAHAWVALYRAVRERR